MTAPSEGIFIIEKSLKQLASEREEAEYQGDSEAITVIDKQIAEYLTKEAAKVTSYVALIRQDEMTVEACKRELERISDIKRVAENRIERMKNNALATMQQFDVKELRATPGGGLRRQDNGGIPPLDTSGVVMEGPDVALDFIVSGARLTLRDWQEVGSVLCWSKRRDSMPVWNRISVQIMKAWAVDNQRVREALNRGEDVPGAKLLPRGEHVRII